MSDDLEFIVIDDIPEYIFCIGDDEENEQVIALSGKDGAFKYEKVDELPTAGKDGVLYLVPKSHTTQTASGNPITATITDDAGQMESFQLDGDTFQQSYTGKNLFNKNTVIIGKVLDADGTLIASTNEFATSDFIPVMPNTTYYKLFSLSVRFKYFNENKEPLSTSSYQDIPNAATAQSFTTPAGAYYIRLSLGSAYLDTLQIELGSTFTSYEPFVGGQPSPSPSYPQDINVVTDTQTISINGTNYPLDLGDIQLCGLGDDGNGNPLYKDRIYRDGDDWKVHKAVGKYQIDGSENWIKQTATDIYYRATDISVPSTTIGYCNYLRVQQAGTTVFAMSNCIRFSGFATDVFISPSSTFADAGAFTTWLRQVKPIVYYPLATATDTTITDQTLIAQLEAIRTAALESGSNTISNTATGTNLAGDLEIGYYGYDPLNKYDKYFWLDVDGAYESL